MLESGDLEIHQSTRDSDPSMINIVMTTSRFNSHSRFNSLCTVSKRPLNLFQTWMKVAAPLLASWVM